MFSIDVLLLILMMLMLVAEAASSPPGIEGHIPLPVMSCDPKNSTCPLHYCCAKKVITYADVSKYAIGFTECQPMRKSRHFCMIITEGFMCPCDNGLVCKTKGIDNFGYCDKAAA